MIDCDKDAYIKKFMKLNYHDMGEELQMAITQHERAREGNPDCAEFLKGIRHWLVSGKRPDGLSETDFLLLKPLAECLVQKGQLKGSILDQFPDT